MRHARRPCWCVCVCVCVCVRVCVSVCVYTYILLLVVLASGGGFGAAPGRTYVYTCIGYSNTCICIFVHIYLHTSQVVEASEQHRGEHQDHAPVGVPREPSMHAAPDACHGQAAPLSAAARELGERRRVAEARRGWRRRFEHSSQPWSFERMRKQAFWLRSLNSEVKRDLFL